MARFKRLTWDDLNTLTRDELLPRLEAEQRYWARKAAGAMSPADQEARRQFGEIVYAVLAPSGMADSMSETAAWLKGERATDTTFWDEKPGERS